MQISINGKDTHSSDLILDLTQIDPTTRGMFYYFVPNALLERGVSAKHIQGVLYGAGEHTILIDEDTVPHDDVHKLLPIPRKDFIGFAPLEDIED